jgi:hypothetical protein
MLQRHKLAVFNYDALPASFMMLTVHDNISIYHAPLRQLKSDFA